MCEFLLSILIVGAVESEPGWFKIEYLQQEQVEEIYIPEHEYVKCSPE